MRLPAVSQLRVDARQVHRHGPSSLAYPHRRASVRWDTFPHLMRIGVPKETAAGEHRVALVPEVVGKLKAKGLEVVVQEGAGADALLPDAAYVEAGARMTG